MHTFTAPNKTTFNFNSDLSGDVQIIDRNRIVTVIPGPDLLHFADLIARRLFASAIDDAGGESAAVVYVKS